MYSLFRLICISTVDAKERALIEHEKKAQAELTATVVASIKTLAATSPGPVVVEVLNCGSNGKVK